MAWKGGLQFLKNLSNLTTFVAQSLFLTISVSACRKSKCQLRSFIDLISTSTVLYLTTQNFTDWNSFFKNWNLVFRQRKVDLWLKKLIWNAWESLIIFLDTYIVVCKRIEDFFIKPKMAIFRKVGMREGGLPLTLAFQYLIFMIWRACDLNLVMISLMASKCQDFKLRGLQFHFIKHLKNGHSNFKELLF